VQGPSSSRERIDPPVDRRVIFERRDTVWLDQGVNHERLCATPIFLASAGAKAVDIGIRIRTRERDSEEVTLRSGGELGVVNQDDHWKNSDRITRRKGLREGGQAGVATRLPRATLAKLQASKPPTRARSNCGRNRMTA
jgi:hypothetical protein